MRVRNVSLLVAAAGMLAASTANADLIGQVTVKAFNADVVGQQIGNDFTATVTGEWVNGRLIWNWSGEATFGNDTNSENNAKLTEIGLDLFADPIVNSNFNVSAGAFNTTFVIDSVILAFPTIGAVEAVGRASAQIGVTASVGLGTPGVTLTGLQSGGSAYSAFFNAPPSPTGPSGSLFSNLITGGTTGGSFSYTGSTGLGYMPLGVAVNDISSQFRFSLSAFDRAAGSSTFEVIPAPGTLALLGLGGLVAGRRRRA